MSYGPGGVGGVGGDNNVDPELKRFLEVESRKAQFQVCIVRIKQIVLGM